MGVKKRAVKKKEKHHRVHRKNKGSMWQVVNGKVVDTHNSCPRCGPGVFMAKHYSRISCGRCGYTKFEAPKAGSAPAQAVASAPAGVEQPQRVRKLQKK